MKKISVRSQSGSILIPALIAAALIGFLSLSLSDVINNAIELQKYSSYNYTRLELRRTLETTFFTGDACRCSLAGVQIDASVIPPVVIGAPTELSIYEDPAVCNPATRQVILDTASPVRGIKTKEITFTDLEVISPTMISATLIVYLEKLKMMGGEFMGLVSGKEATTNPISVNLVVAPPAVPGPYTILGCGTGGLPNNTMKPLASDPVFILHKEDDIQSAAFTGEALTTGNKTVIAQLDYRRGKNFSLEFFDTNDVPTYRYRSATGVDGHVKDDSVLIYIPTQGGKFKYRYDCNNKLDCSNGATEFDRTRILPLATMEAP